MELGGRLYQCEAQECVTLNPVYCESDLLSGEKSFQPQLTHQIFGERETIVGFKNLKIRLNFSARTFHYNVDVKYTSKIAEVEAEELYEMLGQWFPLEKSLSQEALLASLAEDAPLPGDAIFEHSLFQVRRIQPAKASTEEKAFHRRLESMLVWFVDAASRIDDEDTNWNVFVAYAPEHPGSARMVPVGFCTVYNFYSLKKGIRPRVSQFLIFPMYQKLGYGARLYARIIRWLAEMKDCDQVTVESPCEAFITLRDYVECKLCAKLPQFSTEKLGVGCDEEVLAAAFDSFKIAPERVCFIRGALAWMRAGDAEREEISKKVRQNVEASLEQKLAGPKKTASVIDEACNKMLNRYRKVAARMASDEASNFDLYRFE